MGFSIAKGSRGGNGKKQADISMFVTCLEKKCVGNYANEEGSEPILSSQSVKLFYRLQGWENSDFYLNNLGLNTEWLTRAGFQTEPSSPHFGGLPILCQSEAIQQLAAV